LETSNPIAGFDNSPHFSDDNRGGSDMGKVSFIDANGQNRGSTYFGVETGHSGGDFANDGAITDLEISEARELIEKEINQHDCGYGGPLGLGGWGGINEVCVQPWNSGGPEREKTPDGYEMQVTLRLEEEYKDPKASFFSNRAVKTLEVPVTARWEAGHIRLYQCKPPPYAPPPPPPPPVDIIKEVGDGAQYVAQGVGNFFSSSWRFASSSATSLKNYFSPPPAQANSTYLVKR